MGLSLALTQPLSAALDGASVLVIPGWNGSGVGHWQTLWEQKYRRFHRVIQHNWTRPSRAVGRQGHINVASGHGLWPIGEELLRGFVARR